MAFDDSTYSDKQFISNIVESAASATASVRTGVEDGVLLLDSSLTLVNSQGVGTTFAYGFAYDGLTQQASAFNDHDSLTDLHDEVEALVRIVTEWAQETLEATHALSDAAAAMADSAAAVV